MMNNQLLTCINLFLKFYFQKLVLLACMPKRARPWSGVDCKPASQLGKSKTIHDLWVDFRIGLQQLSEQHYYWV